MKNGWQRKQLGDLCQVFADGDWIESKDQSPDGIRLIQTGNVGEGVFKDRGEKARYISEATFKRLRCTEVFENDCLISRLPDPVGRSCILPDTGEKMITAVDCTIVRFNPTQMIPAFFNLYSQSLDYLKAVDSVTTGTTRNRISRSNLRLVPIPVPPLPEQRRIVGLLDEAFVGIATAKANAEKNIHNARALFESHLQAVFTQCGEEWLEKRLSEVCSITSTLVDPRKNEFLDLIHVGAGNIESKTGVLVELKTAREEGLISGKFLFDESMVLYSKIRPYLMKVARPEFSGLCSADMYPLTPLPSQITRDYLFHLLLSKSFTEYAKLADGKERAIQHMMVTSFWHPDGTPMSAQQFMEILFGRLPDFFKDEAELRALWSSPDTRKKLLDGLADKGFGREQMAEMQKIIDAEKSDLFDVLAHVAYALPTLSREERAAQAKGEISAHFNLKQQVFLDFVLGQYVKVGVEELAQEKLAPLLKLKYNNAIADAVADLGRPEEIGNAFSGFQKYLYQHAV